MSEKYETALEYLTASLNVVETKHAECLAKLRENKKDMETLKEDTPKITTKRLQDAAMKTFNYFTVENTNLSATIKAIREDQKWIKKLIKIVLEWNKEHE